MTPTNDPPRTPAGRVALVTGAAQGIGAAIAERLARDSYHVILTDIDDTTVADTAAALTTDQLSAEARHLDVTEPSDAHRVVADVIHDYGTLDVLVNNAGVAVFADPVTLTAEQWRDCLSVDLDGVWHCTQAALAPMLAQQRGAVVNLASVHSFQIIKGCYPYPVAKHAVIGLTRALAVEYADRGIRVNAVCPGYVDTPLTRSYYQQFPDPDAEAGRIATLHPRQRIATPADIAAAVAFLASDDADYITGVSLPVDGGRSLVYHD